MTSTADPFREWDAAYVLGALSVDDRRDFERHLQTCPHCARAVAEVAGMPGLLGALPDADALATLHAELSAAGHGAAPVDAGVAGTADHDDHLRAAGHRPAPVQRLARAAARRARRTRIRLLMGAVAAATVLALGAGAIGATLAGSPTLEAAPAPAGPSAVVTRVVAMEPLEADALTAALTVTDTDWGTRFDWSCVYLDELWLDAGPQDYDMVMTDHAGASTVLATWTATSRSTENLAASTEVSLDQIRSIEIRASLSGVPLAHTDL
jgi:anti-sigma factor RsiW